jgi:dUTP pyrophosphatase
MLKLLSEMSFPGAPNAEVQRQPAGFDLTVAHVSRFAGGGALGFDNRLRELPEAEEIPWIPAGSADVTSAHDFVLLHPGGYLVTYSEQISVPPDSAGLVLPRSSLMRCGAMLNSALWDPGYRGRGQGLLTVFAELCLYRNARIAQFILIALEKAAAELYQGRYQDENT